MNHNTRNRWLIIAFAIGALVLGLVVVRYDVPFIIFICVAIAIGIASGRMKVTLNHSIEAMPPTEDTKSSIGFSNKMHNVDVENPSLRHERASTTNIDNKLQFYACAAYGCWWLNPMLGCLLFPLYLPSSIAGFVIALLKRQDAVGTVYESHFIWIIRTVGVFAAGVLLLPIFFMALLALANQLPRLLPATSQIIAVAGTMLLFSTLVWLAFRGHKRMMKGLALLKAKLPVTS